MSEITDIGENEALSPTEAIEGNYLEWYQEFDEQNWQKEYSLHNPDHIRADFESADLLIQAALKGNDSDPLGIIKDLEAWNKDRPEAKISREELPLVVRIAFAAHDLGNIASQAKEVDGKLSLDYFKDGYKAKNAEARSQQIAEQVIKASELIQDQKDRFQPLVNHLVNETKYDFGEKTQFQVFMRVVDQIGNDLFSSNENRVIGLLMEMANENPEAVFVPDAFFNFSLRRFGELVPSEKTREAVLAIWGKDLPDEIPGLEKGKVRVEDWLAM